ncbi:hypothetical protein SCHPADRAFT_946769 [Schizopora paradoxa]|uniref:Uncharacterized protein n=1 Tax=Schizopora paradoxa TaxID=27342 RepID=A0A0H2R2P6_9AGAM|nr:hypothetical protein SCHPADRAFT_946769 [Schizopora paradoxa]
MPGVGVVSLVWLAEIRIFLEQVEDSVNEGLDWHDVPNVLSRSSYAPSVNLEVGDDYEYSYLYDLDRMVFTMDERIHFPLDNLPHYNEWLSYIGEDGSEASCILPSTPEVYRVLAIDRLNPIKSLTSSEQADLKLYEEATPQISLWHGGGASHLLSSARNIAKVTFIGFISARYATISIINARYDDLILEDLAMELLASAAPAASMLTDSSDADNWLWEMESRLSKAKRMRSRSRLERCNTFWFRGRLIVLARTLVMECHFKSKIGFVVRRAREKGLRECTALLWSVDHVAVVVVADGKVSHSPAIPIIAAYGKEVGGFNSAFDSGLELMMHFLSPVAANGGNSFDACLPLDAFLRIMDFTDKSTSTALARTAKALRLEWLKHPWIGPFLVSGPSANDGFFAHFEKTGQPFKIIMRPFRCLPYMDDDAKVERREEVKYVVYRLPFRYIDYTRFSYFHMQGVPEFERIHGYELQVEELTAEGEYVCLPPESVFRL